MDCNSECYTAIAHNLLDIADINSSVFPELSTAQWDKFLQLLKIKKVYLFLGKWFLEEYEQLLPSDVAANIKADLACNATRNALIVNQTVKLANLFAESSIPFIVLKGSACLLRSSASRNWRFLSDIDIIVPRDAIGDAEKVLLRAEYVPDMNQQPILNSHHIVPYVHPFHAAFIEVHTEPYGLSYFHSPSLPDLWRNAITLDSGGTGITVPSITDHIWILMRTDSIPRPYLPRLCDAIETAYLLSENHEESLDIHLLMERAQRDGCPNIVPGMLYACERYMGLPSTVSIPKKTFERWTAWSRFTQRKQLNSDVEFNIARNRFSAITFTTGHGIIQKLRYFTRIVRYECIEDRATSTYLTHIPPLLVIWRIIKDATVYLWTLREYLLMRFMDTFRKYLFSVMSDKIQLL